MVPRKDVKGRKKSATAATEDHMSNEKAKRIPATPPKKPHPEIRNEEEAYKVLARIKPLVGKG